MDKEGVNSKGQALLHLLNFHKQKYMTYPLILSRSIQKYVILISVGRIAFTSLHVITPWAEHSFGDLQLAVMQARCQSIESNRLFHLHSGLINSILPKQLVKRNHYGFQRKHHSTQFIYCIQDFNISLHHNFTDCCIHMNFCFVFGFILYLCLGFHLLVH